MYICRDDLARTTYSDLGWYDIHTPSPSCRRFEEWNLLINDERVVNWGAPGQI